MRREKRHPTVKDGATIGADASIMGPITVGENASVGAGAVVVDDVTPHDCRGQPGGDNRWCRLTRRY